MAAAGLAGFLLVMLVASWLVALAVDQMLHKLFGGPKSRPPGR